MSLRWEERESWKLQSGASWSLLGSRRAPEERIIEGLLSLLELRFPSYSARQLRLSPEDITINVGEGEPIPVPNIPGKWREVIHDNKVTWLANWKENINGNFKYVFLAASSSLKGQSDMQKFEKARELKVQFGSVVFVV